MPKAPVIAAAIPRSNLRWVAAAEARKPLEAYFKVLHDFNPAVIGGKMPEAYFKVLHDFNPAVIGGKMPDDAFYYAR